MRLRPSALQRMLRMRYSSRGRFGSSARTGRGPWEWAAGSFSAIIVVLAFWAIVDLQRAGAAAQPVQERVRADRRAAQAPLRPDPEPGRDGEGLHEARARDARSRDQGAQRRRSRAAQAAAGATRRPGGDAGPAQAEGALTGALGRLLRARPRRIPTSRPTRTCSRSRRSSPAPRTRSRSRARRSTTR